MGVEALMDPDVAVKLLGYLNIYSPIVLYCLFHLTSFASDSCSTRKIESGDWSSVETGSPPSRKKLSRSIFKWLSALMLAIHLNNAVLILSTNLMLTRWWQEKTVMIHTTGSVVLYATTLLPLLHNDKPTQAHFACWSTAIMIEFAKFGSSSLMYSPIHQKSGYEMTHAGQVWRELGLTFDIIRMASLLTLIILYARMCTSNNCGQAASQWVNRAPEADEYERNHESTDNGPNTKTMEPRCPLTSCGVAPSGSWWRYFNGYKVFFPYMWPSESRHLQAIAVACFCLTICQTVINILVPYQMGVVTEKVSTQFETPWLDILMYAIYKWLQGEDGLLKCLRSILWKRVHQHSSMKLSITAFEHIHSLSLDFHLGKRNDEILLALRNGISITTFLELMTFQVVPALFDFAITLGCLWVYFDAYSALFLCILAFGYLCMTAHLAQTGSKLRRDMLMASSEENAVKNDSLVSYETVKYFNAEEHEADRYYKSVEIHQKAEFQLALFLNLMGTCQNTFFMIGLLAVCYIVAYRVSGGHCSVGQFIYLTTYMSQLHGTLKFLTGTSRPIQATLIDSECMLELFQKQPTVVDSPHARPLATCSGDIRFENVTFSYDKRKPALNKISFSCQAGTMTALVGESGGGKSTVFRLLFRFYNPDKGCISIDGHEVRDLSIDSVRKNIGVVPQDTVLFNETLMYNLKYANRDATDEEVYEACRTASIHDKIMRFPDGYSTKVGSRGLRLSGGEKQRVAIARAILKNSKIILFDEATASLDTHTEENIQKSLGKLRGRTTLVIAHRLSTVTAADLILVLHEGQVVESGTHKELLLIRDGCYAGMWQKQTGQTNLT